MLCTVCNISLDGKISVGVVYIFRYIYKIINFNVWAISKFISLYWTYKCVIRISISEDVFVIYWITDLKFEWLAIFYAIHNKFSLRFLLHLDTVWYHHDIVQVLHYCKHHSSDKTAQDEPDFEYTKIF